MDERTVLLVGVADPYRWTLASWSKRRGARPMVVEGEVPAAPPATLCLCVVDVEPYASDAPARLRALVAKVRCPVVVLAHELRIRSVVEIMRLGIADLIELPAQPTDVAMSAFAHFVEPDLAPGMREFVGESTLVQSLRREVAAAASTRSTALILGETGTGKGLLAAMIHRLSPFSDRPFVHVDCAALSPTLIESELFGHERGSFTGATERRTGRFELAENGTILLDEIGDLPASLQTKLLRVLQDRRFERVGGSRALLMRARVIAATSRNLRQLVRDGRFRRDLYFRLNVLRIQIPPLRERPDDIPLLVRHGVEQLSQQLGVPRPAVSEGFCRRLATHDWPGNVRELMNALERCLVHHRADTLEAEDLDEVIEELEVGSLASDVVPGDPRMELDLSEEASSEREAIRNALVATGGNVSRVARRLGMPRTTLRRRVREYGLGHMVPQD